MIALSNFEENVLKLLGEMNQRQIDFQKEVNNRFDKVETELKGLKETTNMIFNEVASSKEDITRLDSDVEEIKKEQEFHLTMDRP